MEHKKDMSKELRYSDEFNKLLEPLISKVNEIRKDKDINKKFVVHSVQFLLTDIWVELEEIKK